MKKKMLVLSLVLIVMLLAPACKKKAAGQMNSEALLAMVPEGPVMVMAFDFQRLAALNFFDKALKDDWQKNAKAAKDFKDYQDFVQKTGIDLQKDVYAIVAAVYGSFEMENPDALGIVNLKYDEGKLLAIFKEKNVFTAEEPYGGRVLYTLKSDDAKDMRLAFLNKANIAIGSPAQVKQAIDMAAKGGKSVKQTAALMKYVDQLDKKSMFWLVVGSIPAKVKEAPAGGMMPVDLSKAEAFTAVADFKNKVLSGELRLISNNEAGNKQVADMLNGLKSLGAMGAAKEPELGELLNGIQLSSAADHIKLTFSLSEELMNKLGAKAKDKAQSMAAPAQPEPLPAEPLSFE
ncbi:MAG: hypothetical protein MUC72_10965 [Acidobacteria bacterium]|nr:hypothetical protein [Acidobacteriota bacterium]